MFCRRFSIDLTPVVDVAAEFAGLVVVVVVVVLETSACNLAAFLSVAIAAAFDMFVDGCDAGVTVVVVVVVVGCFAGTVFTTLSFFTFFVGAATVGGFSSGLSSKSRTDGTLVADVFAVVVVVFPLGLVVVLALAAAAVLAPVLGEVVLEAAGGLTGGGSI